VLVPIWLLCIKPLLASRNVVLAAWQNQQASSQLPGWAIYMPLLVFGLVYFVAAPPAAIFWAIFIRTRPHIRLAQKLLRASGVTVRYDEGPEVWDEILVGTTSRGGSVYVSRMGRRSRGFSSAPGFPHQQNRSTYQDFRMLRTR